MRTEPKSSEVGDRLRGGVAALPISETNSSEVAASDAIWSDAICTPALCGIELTAIMQVVPGMTVAQLDCTPKSGVAVAAVTCRVTLPVFVSVMLCGAETLPTGVTAKLSELCDTA